MIFSFNNMCYFLEAVIAGNLVREFKVVHRLVNKRVYQMGMCSCKVLKKFEMMQMYYWVLGEIGL